MLDHITITVADFARSQTFYDAVLAPFGIARLHADGDKAAGYGREGKARFWIVEQDRTPTQVHVAFKAADADAVTAFHRAALANGGRDNGPPGPRPQYHDRYFAAFSLDPDGNNVEAVIQQKTIANIAYRTLAFGCLEALSASPLSISDFYHRLS